MTRDAKNSRKRVLIVEDEWLLASSLATEFKAVELEPVGPVATSDKAISLIEQGDIDAAVMDANLSGVFAADVAKALRARDIPFLIVSGYSLEQMPEDMRNVTLLEKPVRETDVISAVQQLLN